MDVFGNCIECGGGIEGSIDHMDTCPLLITENDTKSNNSRNTIPNQLFNK